MTVFASPRFWYLVLLAAMTYRAYANDGTAEALALLGIAATVYVALELITRKRGGR